MFNEYRTDSQTNWSQHNNFFNLLYSTTCINSAFDASHVLVQNENIITETESFHYNFIIMQLHECQYRGLYAIFSYFAFQEFLRWKIACFSK